MIRLSPTKYINNKFQIKFLHFLNNPWSKLYIYDIAHQEKVEVIQWFQSNDKNT